MINFDYYSLAREIIKKLEADGHFANAAKLSDALDGGATGTEIFMALRYYLLPMKEDLRLGVETVSLIKKLLVELDKGLGSR